MNLASFHPPGFYPYGYYFCVGKLSLWRISGFKQKKPENIPKLFLEFPPKIIISGTLPQYELTGLAVGLGPSSPNLLRHSPLDPCGILAWVPRLS